MSDRSADGNSPPLPACTAEGRERIRRIWQEIIEVVQVRYNVTEAEAERQVSGWAKQLGMGLEKK